MSSCQNKNNCSTSSNACGPVVGSRVEPSIHPSSSKDYVQSSSSSENGDDKVHRRGVRHHYGLSTDDQIDFDLDHQDVHEKHVRAHHRSINKSRDSDAKHFAVRGFRGRRKKVDQSDSTVGDHIKRVVHDQAWRRRIANRQRSHRTLKQQEIATGLVRSGIEENPGPPGHGDELAPLPSNWKVKGKKKEEKEKIQMSDPSLPLPLKTETIVRPVAMQGDDAIYTREARRQRGEKQQYVHPRMKGGRPGGRDALVASAIQEMHDKNVGDAIARIDARKEKDSKPAEVKPQAEVQHLGAALSAPRDVHYRVGDLAKEGKGVRRFTLPYKLVAGLAICLLLSAVVHGWTLYSLGVVLDDPRVFWDWVGVVAGPTIILLDVVSWLTRSRPKYKVVSKTGYFTRLASKELEERKGTADKHDFVGRYVGYRHWRLSPGLVTFASPDRLDSRVICVPNLWTVERREVYCRDKHLVDRKADVHVSGTLINAIAAERFGMLRGKSYDEGRRILQLYADTQNHTQIDLSWNLQGEPTSLAENTVEYLCALRMCEAGDSTRLKGVEARCFQ
jgi:hypothetical protein